MGRKRHTPEKIIGNLREAQAGSLQRQTAAQVCRSLGIAVPTFYRRRAGDRPPERRAKSKTLHRKEIIREKRST